MKGMSLAFVALAVTAIGVVSLAGCLGQPKAKEPLYHITCEGGMELEGAEDRAEGEEVTAYLLYIATDVDYSFYVKGTDSTDVDYSEGRGYTITFVMPDHDVTVGYTTRNSMVYFPDEVDPDEAETDELGTSEEGDPLSD